MMARDPSSSSVFAGVTDLAAEMGRMFDLTHSTGVHGGSESEQPRGHADAWTPRLDLFVCGNELVIRAALPGATSDEVEVSVADGTLSISGFQGFVEDEQSDCAYYTRELPRGQFRRSLTLPREVRHDEIRSNLADGLLEIRVTAPAGATTSAIPVTTNPRT